jgi:hypothetical protein
MKTLEELAGIGSIPRVWMSNLASLETAKQPNIGDRLAISPHRQIRHDGEAEPWASRMSSRRADVYFSADVETDGPIPGPYSMLSFALVYAGRYDGRQFRRATRHDKIFYKELKPISNEYQEEALKVNGLDRNKLIFEGDNPEEAMIEAFEWISEMSKGDYPVLVAYPLSFDWTWLYWYFVKFCKFGSPFDYSRCFDIKTALAVKASIPIAEAGRSRLPEHLISTRPHTHHAIDDAIEQAEIFANVFEWGGINGEHIR